MNQHDQLSRVEHACGELAASGEPVTFTAVSARAGIGRATLYRDTALRALVTSHRHQAAATHTLTDLADDIAALRAALEAVAARVRHHEEELRQIKRAGPRAPREN